MEKRRLGSTGRQVSVIGLGTWNMDKDGHPAVEALRRGMTEGADHIDTAEMYGSGRVEEIVGEAISGLRERVFLTSKVLPSNASYEGTLKACERSLTRLGTDHLDLYLLHWRGTIPLEETFSAFEKLHKDGKILAFGVSNFDVKDMEEAIRIVGPDKIACNQVLYHLKERAIESDLLPWCQKRNIPVVAYSPFGQGKFPKSPVLEEQARTSNATPYQVALSFLIRHAGVIAIPKSSNPEHVVENVQAGSLKLTEESIRRIDEEFPARRRQSLPML